MSWLVQSAHAYLEVRNLFDFFSLVFTFDLLEFYLFYFYHVVAFFFVWIYEASMFLGSNYG